MIRLIIFFAIISICTISQPAYAQKKHIDDVYGVSDKSKTTEPEKLTIVDDQKFWISDFVQGHILLPSGDKKSGIIRFDGNAVVYKDTVADKSIKYSSKDIIGFVALADTFKVYTDTAIIPPTPHMASFGDKLFITKRFVKELIYGNKVCLYKTSESKTPTLGGVMIPVGPQGALISMSAGLMIKGKTYVKNTFYLKRPGEIQYTCILTNNKDFKKLLAKYFRDNDALVQDIKADKLVYEDIEEIVNQYNKKS